MSAPPAPKKARKSEASKAHEDSILCDDNEEDSPFTLYFIETSDGVPTEQEIRNLKETFKISKKAGVMPEWIDSGSVEHIKSSDDFFVLPCFRGKLFQKLQENKLKLYGPPIIRECLEEMKSLPQCTHPVFSSVFDGARISFTSLDPEEKKDLGEKIAWMNGVFNKTLYHETTHLISGKAEHTEKYKSAVKNSIKLMRKEWVEHLWQTSQTTMGKFSAIGRDAVESYKLRVFEGLEISISSIDGVDRTNLIQLVEEHGGRVSGNMSKNRCSHLITDKTSGQKYLKASEWKTVRIVQTRWIRKCIDAGSLISEAKYHPKYLSAEHFRSSTPKKDTSVIESAPDISSIVGNGGRLINSSFSMSSSMTPTEQSFRQSCSSFVSISSTSNVTSSTINNDKTVGKIGVSRNSDQFSTLPLRKSYVPMVRIPTSQNIEPVQNSAGNELDLIANARKLIDDGLRELFENCIFYIIGKDQATKESLVRLFNDTGATRVAKFESATHVVVINPSQQDRASLRKIVQQEDINIVTVQWVIECVKKRKLVNSEDFHWTENMMDDSQSQTLSYESSQLSDRTFGPNDTTGVFSSRTYSFHSSLHGQPIVATLSDQIEKLGGQIEPDPEKADFVIFGPSAPMHTLLTYDKVITTLYVDQCINIGHCIRLGAHALLVPLPKPPLLLFRNQRFVLRENFPHVRGFIKSIIEENGGIVINEMDSNSFQIMVGAGQVRQEHRSRTADLSWIISSVCRCQLQPFKDHIYKEKTEPLLEFERDDDVWAKCVLDRNESTEVIERELEDRYKVEERPYETRSSDGIANITAPYRNPYFPDLRKPYKMDLNLESANRYIDDMESPPRETPESTMTNSRIGSILRRAVVNTGRTIGKENEDEPMTCEVIKSRVVENRRTVSSTPVLVRDLDRSMRHYEPMDESFADQNQEHEELNRMYAMHPRFLLSISNMSPQESADLLEAIKQLGGRIEKDYNRDVTHLITSKMQRTPKVLCSIAAGKWCLTPEYVTKSTASGRWIDEKKFEWTPDKLPKTVPARESPKERENRIHFEKLVAVCKPWRIRIDEMPITSSVRMENRTNGAFTGWRCVIHQDDRTAQLIASILEAGGAVVHSITDYIEITDLEPNRVFAVKDFKWNVQSAAMLKQDKIPLYVIDFVYEYLVNKDNLDYSNLLHPVYKNL
ncbi:Protein CBR-MUS-101 [Caenorhabditis briggsae]|uniref:BRCT domain-containing protein n=2 Tax=Caenorhabditis briggsae TaxID=6238 RepID=A0AAE9IZR1_CAEBR|nr:Protein CBR-MUS-101 [Caenorhabditis briggsae]ULU12110.1 hypothetical protein L3Y34_015451 [Caenorhabditis briggsae]CAP23347.2 Protein CBR-MUS-101 [Caenorhabditis briggsae]